MFILGILILLGTVGVAYVMGDTEKVSKSDVVYGVPLLISGWLIFAPIRRMMFGPDTEPKHKQLDEKTLAEVAQRREALADARRAGEQDDRGAREPPPPPG
jgi:hypothetical protein